MQPQQVRTNTVTSHITYNVNGLSEEALSKRKKVIYELGKTELAIGCVMTAFGVFTSVYSTTYLEILSSNGQKYYHRVLYNYGEGIWCGIWVIIAGGLGIGAGARTSTPCLINTHMGFSIVGALASGTFCVMTASFARIEYRVAFYCALMSTMSIVSFATTVLLIVSASYCCCGNIGGCCNQQVYTRPMSQYVNTPTVLPVEGLQRGAIANSRELLRRIPTEGDDFEMSQTEC